MAFGKRQLNNPTPAHIGRTVTIISIVCGLLQGYIMTARYIPSYIGEYMGGFLGFLVALANALKPFFGVEVERKTIPSDQVTEVEVQEEKKEDK